MRQILKNHILGKLGDNIENLEFVLDKFEVLHVKKKQFILEQNQACNHIYFVAKGSLQVFTYNENYEENTREIIIEEDWYCNFQSFIDNKKNLETVRAIENSILVRISKEDYFEFMFKIKQFSEVFRQIILKKSRDYNERVDTFLRFEAKERIDWLSERNPEFFVRFSSKLLASYLGINKDVYSRIRKKNLTT